MAKGASKTVTSIMQRTDGGPTFQELSEQIAQLQMQAEELRRKEVAEVIEKIKAAVVHYGITAADLGLSPTVAKRGRPAKSVGAKSGGKASSPVSNGKTSRPAKFTDGAGKMWSGVGKRPDWFKALIASGKKPEELLVRA